MASGALLYFRFWSKEVVLLSAFLQGEHGSDVGVAGRYWQHGRHRSIRIETDGNAL